jgi:putative PIN family toxin of toxin-antitoxin system
MAKAIRIIIDTNLWISYLLTKQFDFLDNLFERNKIQLLFSQELLEEFTSVTKRPKLKKFFKQDDVNQLLEIISNFAEFVDVKSETKVCRDEKDDFLLSLAYDGSADYLVTGDKDLLVIEKYKNTKIVKISDFEKLMTKMSL